MGNGDEPTRFVSRLEACLVHKAIHKHIGNRLLNTYSNVTKLSSVRSFFSIDVVDDQSLHQLELNNNFLCGDLQEDVYIEQPPRFVAQGENGKACHLLKSLYSLTHSPRIVDNIVINE